MVSDIPKLLPHPGKKRKKEKENLFCALEDASEQKFRVGEGNRALSRLLGEGLSWDAGR